MKVEHEEQDTRGRFVVRFGDDDAELVYTRLGPKVIDIQHTYVPEGARGQGVAEELAKAAFAYARDGGDRVVVTCPFVRQWLHSHPDEAKLVDAPPAASLERRP